MTLEPSKIVRTLLEGSRLLDGLVAELVDGAEAEMNQVAQRGGAVEAVPYMKAQWLVESNRERIAKIERGEIIVVGQNKFSETRGVSAHHRRGRRHPDAGPGGRARADRGRSRSGSAQRDQGAVDGPREARRSCP